MKKNILFPALVLLFAGSVITGCQTSTEKVVAAQEKVRKANNDAAFAQMELNQTIKDTIADYEQFKQEFEARILVNDKFIADFKTQRSVQKEENLAKYEEKLARLELTNNNLKKKLVK
jgi:uncharacterized protein (DUF3084 family)